MPGLEAPWEIVDATRGFNPIRDDEAVTEDVSVFNALAGVSFSEAAANVERQLTASIKEFNVRVKGVQGTNQGNREDLEPTLQS